MDTETQEALSHQHSHGIWIVALDDGRFAVFSHTLSDKLLGIFHAWELGAACRNFAAAREFKRKVAKRELPDLNLDEIEI